jgi:transcriptional regulator with XRE-family HTH domain
MEASHLVRAARRHAGVSQRGLAALSGASASTVAAVEAGQRAPSVAMLAGLLDAAGLELGLQPRTPSPCKHLRRYLRLSLVERLYLAVGGRRHPVHDRDCAPWRELWALAARGRVEVVGEAAVGVWAPVVASRPQVRFTPWAGAPGVPATTTLEVLGPLRRAPASLVPVGLLSREAHVATPELMSIRGESRLHGIALQAAARLLHEEGPVDGGARRPAAHRDPQPRKDDHQVRHTKAFGQRRLPEPADRRGWQLDGAVSLAQWLRRYGYPT